MKNSLFILLAVFLMLGLQIQAQVNSAISHIFAFTDVTIIDVKDSSNKNPYLKNMTVLINKNRIVEVGQTKKVKIPKDAEIIDAKGMFLIPGLWDMHVHSASMDTSYPLFVANGITGIRDMGGPSPERISEWRKDEASGKIIGPQIVAAGLLLDGPKPIFPFSIAVSNQKEGQEAVDSLKERGADFIKVYSLLSRDAYLAIAAEAKQQKISYVGHVTPTVSAGEASDAGQKSIEHLDGIFLAISDEEEKLRKTFIESLNDADPVTAFRKAENGILRSAMESYNKEKAAVLFKKFKKNNTWQVPTLAVLGSYTFMDERDLSKDPRLKYIPQSIRERWSKSRPRNTSPEAVAVRKKLFQQQLDLVREMHQNGIEFLAGTDTPNSYCLPGFGLHDELALLVKAGFTPLQALQTATYNPAKFFGLLTSLGTVEKGKIANLVLLESDPLQDISNTTKIAGVVNNGKVLKKQDINELLQKIETAIQK